MDNNSINNDEIWICNNEIFPPSKHNQRINNKKHTQHDKIKFLMIPAISFFIVGIMFGQGKEYEYKETISYTVVEGDTLWDISRRYLGKGYKYVQIVAENETDNPDLIYAGETYQITITYKMRSND